MCAKAKKEAPEAKAQAPAEKVTPRFMALYNDEIKAKLFKDLQKTNVHLVPKLEKIVVSMGVGIATEDAAHVQNAAADLAIITGQKPIITKATKSVSNFKLREGNQVGCKVTLRGARMYEFLERLICIALPRIRDFRGISAKGFDGNGNFSFGLNDQLVFPEINPDKVKRQQGMNITFVTNTTSDADCKAMLKEFGMPFVKNTNAK
ncbi:50S ribosomal protein L5 [bacterium]|nr:50S ribosomal protein L5 [bacterium]